MQSATSAISFSELSVRTRHPAFRSLSDCIARFVGDEWPTLSELNQRSGLSDFLFVPSVAAGLSYEQQIFTRREIPTRTGNWHDFFNALIWMAYPHAKRTLSARHAAILAAGGEAERRRRSPIRDSLTLLDEGGVVVAYSDSRVPQLLRGFEWRALFWDLRVELRERWQVFVFGHASLERLLEPLIGLTNKCLLMPVEANFFAQSALEQRMQVDQWVATSLLDDALLSVTRNLPPLPLLGIEGYHPRTQHAEFYNDSSYFRLSYQKP